MIPVPIRVRAKIHPDELEAKKGKVLTEDDYNVLLTGPSEVYRPDGQLIAKYMPGYFAKERLDSFYDVLHGLRNLQTDNRGLASGMQRARNAPGQTRTRTGNVPSGIIGAFDANPPKMYCRLTAFSGRETEKFASLFPLFQSIGDAFAEHVPDKFQSQMAFVKRTADDWVVPGTPFTTITVNNSYPTGVHTDKGDLEEGFSNLTTLRRGSYRGGTFVFVEYRVGVDMKDGDLLLMDAHQWHGNTAMFCNVCDKRMGPPEERNAHEACGSERISIVCYYRTKMADCGNAEEEAARAAAWAEHRMTVQEREVEEMAAEALG